MKTLTIILLFVLLFLIIDSAEQSTLVSVGWFIAIIPWVVVFILELPKRKSK